MPTHKVANAFIRKYNKEFAIKGYSKMNIHDKLKLIDKKLKHSNRDIRKEWIDIKGSYHKTLPKEDVKKPEPKKKSITETNPNWKNTAEGQKIIDMIDLSPAKPGGKLYPKKTLEDYTDEELRKGAKNWAKVNELKIKVISNLSRIGLLKLWTEQKIPMDFLKYKIKKKIQYTSGMAGGGQKVINAPGNEGGWYVDKTGSQPKKHNS